ncbi:hypothetical protein ACLKA7_001850, partial [Drosophila subpalustris]
TTDPEKATRMPSRLRGTAIQPTLPGHMSAAINE